MEKKFIFAGIPVLALLLIMIFPLISFWGHGANLFNLFDADASFVAILFILASLGVAYCAWVNKYLNYACYAMLLPLLVLFIKTDGHFLGAGFWFYLILAVAEIVLVLKPDLLDSICGKKE